MVNQNLGGLFQRLFRVNGTIRRNLKNQFFVVRFLFYTEVFNRIFHVPNRRIDRVDRNYVHIVGGVAVLIGGNVATAFVDGDIDLKTGV